MRLINAIRLNYFLLCEDFKIISKHITNITKKFIHISLCSNNHKSKRNLSDKMKQINKYI